MPVFEVEREGRTFEVDAPTAQAAVASIKRLGMPASPSDASNVGGLPDTASPIDYAAQSLQVAHAQTPQAPVVDPNSPEGFAQLRAEANAQMMQASPIEAPRFGNALKPYLGGHNPIAETYDSVIDPFIPTAPRGPQDVERRKWLSERSIGERFVDTSNFVASLPVRMATQGQYGLGDVISATGFDGSGIAQAEQNFVRANAPQLGAIQTVGDAALGAFGANAQPFPRSVGRPRTPRPERPGAAQRAQAATSDLQSFEDAQVPVFAPSFGASMTQATAKGLSDTFAVGAPLQDALENTYRGVREASQRVAESFGDARTAKEVGDAVGSGLERFKDARPADIVEDAIAQLPDNRLSDIIAAPTSGTSLKTKQGALYERAWRQIPEEMRAGRSVEGITRVMGSPEQTRNVLSVIHDRHRRMTVQSGTNAVPDAATRPIQGGGLLARMTDALMNPRWTANLQTLRDMRSEFRRLASGMSDTEKNVLKLSDIDRVQSAMTADMIALLQRNVDAYRQQGTPTALRTAAGFERSIREFRRADRFTRLSMERLDRVEKLFKAESSEALARNITNAALAGGKGNIDLLQALHRILRNEELGEVAAGVISELGRPIGSARGLVQDIGFSVESFITRWNNMTPEARTLLFGLQHAKALNDLIAVARRLANVESFANRSNTFRSGGNALGIAATAGTAISGGLAGIVYLAGAVGSTYALSYLLSRPGYARWATRYLQIKATGSKGSSVAMRPAVVRQIGQLAKMARNDPALASIVASLAIHERIPLNEVTEIISESNLAGGQGSAQPRAELRSYSPSPSENAAFYARRGAEAIGIPPGQAEQFGSGIGSAVGLFTPADDVATALQTGTAGATANAALNFIPGFRGAKKATEASVAALEKEVIALQDEFARLGGRGRPRPAGFEPLDTRAQGLAEMKEQLTRDIGERRDANIAASPKTSVPVTSSPHQREVSRFIEDTPTIAIPGRQGFAPKEEQKRLVQQHFQSGGDLPPAPWGRTAHMAREDVKRILADAHAKGRNISDKAVSAVEDVARKADDAANKLQELKAFSDAAPNRGDVQTLQRQLERAEKDAAFWRAQYEKIKKQHFGD